MEGAGPRVIRLPPYKYVHVLDTNSNVSRVLSGPLTYTRQEHEHVLTSPQDMIVLPAQHYVEIRNPVVISETGEVVRDKFNQAKLRHGEIEFRVFDKYPEPFPLYPGEVQTNGSFLVQPRTTQEVVETVWALTIKKDEALKFRAERKCKDALGVERDAGEEWLVRTPGSYLAQIDEILVDRLQAFILTDKKALHLRALRTFTDVYGVHRKAGEEWLVTSEIAETHVQDVHEDVVGSVPVITLTNRQYCVIVDPVVNGVQKRGTRELRKGETSFFLLPGESLENGIQDVLVLADDEAVLVHATESFVEVLGDEPNSKRKRDAGERWMVHGSREYIPPMQVQVLEVRRAIPLDSNEGVYVREKKSGSIRAVKGQTYKLQPTEELWPKHLPPDVEKLLVSQCAGSAYIPDPTGDTSHVANSLGPQSAFQPVQRSRDATRVVTFEVPHNAAIQVYDYKTTTSRILFGPTMVMLEPEEQFTILRLSGGVPKRPNVIKTLCLQLGPDFMRDQIIVETSDHARLSLTIAYNWHFQVDPSKADEASKVFNVKDFVGDACKTLASRIRGAVAVETFDHFHKHSAQIIRHSIFGSDDKGKIRSQLMFASNNLCITNVDIQSAEPVDQLTRESLQKSVQLAIEITTQSQEARAKAQAMKEEEIAKGLLQKQQLENQAAAEAARKQLVHLTAECSAVEAEGAAVGKAKAIAQAAEIEGQAAVRQAELRAQAERITHEENLSRLKQEQELKLVYAKECAEVEVRKKRELMGIEAEKFQQMVNCIGKETLVEFARAGPDAQVKMLQALGLQGYLITDGNSPVNLVGTAEGIIRGISKAPSQLDGKDRLTGPNAHA
ncbi:TPA: hypothetical protein N0F65_008325 [Lagenidium giganteum]|uniref:Major vault protein n=1 Tax=Lagenidium giganteum TaxID=4803 RepID=A0AAV2YMN3_9STRA|nr:TPA: hypothetical protein N0F65_008325 [Lagenidium giganteum]